MSKFIGISRIFKVVAGSTPALGTISIPIKCLSTNGLFQIDGNWCWSDCWNIFDWIELWLSF